MTNFIKTRSFDQRNGQGGFAIGLILLVVLLIAVIVGAIAIASRSSSSGGTQEKDRVAASSLLTQAQTFNNAFTRATQGGGFSPRNVYLSYVPAGTNAAVRNDQANLVGANGFLQTPQINITAYTAGTCGNANPIDTAIICQIILSNINLAHPAGVSTVIYTRPLTDPVAKQVNSILWSLNPSSTIPTLTTALTAEVSTLWGKQNAPATIGDATVLTLASAALQNTTAITPWNGQNGTSQGVDNSNLPSINGDERGEGVFNATATLGGNVYFRVLDNL
jgi:hypothetical protein